MSKELVKLAIQGFESSGLRYGDILNHSDIYGWADLSFPDFSAIPRAEHESAANNFSLARLAVTDGLREYLLTERQMYLKSLPGTGYRIVEPAEQTDAAVKKGVHMIEKGMKHAAKGVENINKAMMTAQEREYNSSVKARLKGLSLLLGRKRDYLELE